MSDVSTEHLSRALAGRGVDARRTGHDSICVTIGGDYEAEVRLKAGVWWLHTPAVGERANVVKAVGKAATADVERLADRLIETMSLHWPLEVSAQAPTIKVEQPTDVPEATPWHLLAAALSGPAGLAGQVRLESGPGWTHVVASGEFGSLRLSTDTYDYFLDLSSSDAGNLTFVVGRVGEERGAANHAVAAVRAFTPDARRGAVSKPSDLSKLLHLLSDQHDAEMIRGVEGDTWISIPGTRTTRTARIDVVNRLVLGQISSSVMVFGTLSATPAQRIADEILSRLELSPYEQADAVQAWDSEGDSLEERLRSLLREANSVEGAASPGRAIDRLERARAELRHLRQQGGPDALVAAHTMVEDIERPSARSTRIPRPQPRMIRQWSDAEAAAAEWMEWFGFGTATVCGGPSDGGVDVRANSGIAQVKDYGAPVGASPVRELAGVALLENRQAVFFARSGYTREAINFADRASISLVQFDLQGSATPVNVHAERLFDNGVYA